MSDTNLPLDEAALGRILGRSFIPGRKTIETLITQSRAALTLRARVAELEAECDERRNAMDDALNTLAEQVAHANRLRDALEAVTAMAADLTLTLDQNTPGIESFPLLKKHVGVGARAMDVLASTPAADLSAHDAEVGMRVVSECAMTMRSKCDCSHCDENAPGWEGRAIVERALAAQEVKP